MSNQNEKLKDFSPAGMNARAEVAGDEWFKVNMENMTEWDKYWQIHATNTSWSTTWARGIVPRETLSMVTMGMLAAEGHWGEFEHHFRNALLRTKVPLIQLREIMLHISLYCGIPTGAEIWKIARRVLKEENIDLSQLTPLDSSNINYRASEPRQD
jgi:alkylhydroperoxidase/carboxymuconolactone decarboxylase family protein YurZ